jgi:hypothetical protein
MPGPRRCCRRAGENMALCCARCESVHVCVDMYVRVGQILFLTNYVDSQLFKYMVRIVNTTKTATFILLNMCKEAEGLSCVLFKGV